MRILLSFALAILLGFTSLNAFAKEENQLLRSMPIDNDYKTFLDKNEERLNEDFNRKNTFQTSVRGLKVRGVYNSQEEAEETGNARRCVPPLVLAGPS